jgi:predicted DNA-binding transcriptional regulator AlpA
MTKKQIPPEDMLLDRAEAAELFGVKVTTIDKWHSDDRAYLGFPTAIKKGGRNVWRRDELLDWGEDTGRLVVED